MASTHKTDQREAFRNALRETADQHWFTVSVVTADGFKTILTRASDKDGASACVEDFYLQKCKEAKLGQEPDLQNILQLTEDVATEDRILFVTKGMTRAHKLDLAEVVLGVKVTGCAAAAADAENDGIMLRNKHGKVHLYNAEHSSRPAGRRAEASGEELRFGA